MNTALTNFSVQRTVAAFLPLMAIIAVACSKPAPTPTSATPPTPVPTSDEAGPDAVSFPTFTDQQRALLTGLNEWCASTPDSCAMIERSDLYPSHASNPDTEERLQSQLDALTAAGLEVVWDHYGRRYHPQIEQDLQIVIGGNFSPDHLGPPGYAAIEGRVGAQAGLALGLLVRRAEQADPAELSTLHLPALFPLTRASEPALTRRAVERLSVLYRRAIETGAPTDDPHRVDRLRDRLRFLESF